MNQKPSRPSKKPASTLDRLKAVNWPFLIFLGSLGFMAMLYGMMAMKYKLPPYAQVDHAIKAFEALGNMEDETLASSVNHIAEDETPKPSFTTLDPAAGKELLLVTGGPNQDAVHCPKFGCLAWIIDRSGKVLHSWPLPLDTLFEDVKDKFDGKTELLNFYPVGVQLQDDGSIIAAFHGRNIFPYTVGIARISWDGKVLWKRIDGAHHWMHNLPGGRIAAPIQSQHPMKSFGDTMIDVRCKKVIYDEGVRIYAANGATEQTIMLKDALIRSDYPGLFYSLRDDCDPFHINSVDVVTPEIAPHITGAAVGDLLLSVREPSAIMLIDPKTETIKKIVSGRTAAQHSAHFLPDGTVVAFDNQGGSKKTGGSRIVRINLNDGSSRTIFPTAASKPVLPFFSTDGSNVAVSPDGKRLMLSVKDESRDIEIDVGTGKALWVNKRVMDIAPFMGKSDKPVAGYFKAYGTYFIPEAQAKLLPLKR